MKLLTPALALAALILHTASAAPQSTATSEAATSTSIPRACAQIAKSPRVPGCTTEEFDKHVCSAGCARALKTLESAIVDACEGVSGGGPVVDASLSGELVERVCSEGVEEDDDDTGAEKTSAAGPASPTVTPPAEPTPDKPEGKEVEGEGQRERPNGVGGSPFDIVAEEAQGGSGRVGARWVSAAAALGAVLLVAR